MWWLMEGVSQKKKKRTYTPQQAGEGNDNHTVRPPATHDSSFTRRWRFGSDLLTQYTMHWRVACGALETVAFLPGLGANVTKQGLFAYCARMQI